MENIREYPVHPLARLFPPLSPEQYEALVASIMAIGLLDPIIVWQGQIIDGLHRQRACREAGVQPRYELLDDDADPVQYVIAKNGTRRDMDESQRAVVAHELSQWSAPGRPRENDGNCSDVNSFTQVRWTRLLGQDRGGIKRESRCFRFLRQSIPSPVEHLGSGPVAQGLMWPLVVEPEVAPKPKPRWDVHFQGGQWYGRTALRLRDKDTVGHPGSGSQCATNVDSTLASV